MAKIPTRPYLELPSLEGNQFRAKVNYVITFKQSEVSAGARYRHTVRLFADDTNTDDAFPDDRDEDITTLLNQVIVAQDTPLTVELDEGPFPTSILEEDVLDDDEIRARVVVRPLPQYDEFATARKESNQVLRS